MYNLKNDIGEFVNRFRTDKTKADKMLIKLFNTDHISAFWDVMSTSAEIAGVKYKDTDGISFLLTLLGKNQRRL